MLPNFFLISSSQQDAHDISPHRQYAPSIIPHRFPLTWLLVWHRHLPGWVSLLRVICIEESDSALGRLKASPKSTFDSSRQYWDLSFDDVGLDIFELCCVLLTLSKKILYSVSRRSIFCFIILAPLNNKLSPFPNPAVGKDSGSALETYWEVKSRRYESRLVCRLTCRQRSANLTRNILYITV